MIIHAPHQVLGLLEQKGNMWVTAERMGRYQAILNNPKVSLKTVKKLTPTCLLPEPSLAALRQSTLK